MSIKLTLPDKYVRKALFNLLNDMTVNDKLIKVYDSRVSGNIIPSEYILMSTQNNSVNRGTKCGRRYESGILLEIITRYTGAGNIGSRVLADDILEAVRLRLENDLTLEGELNVIDMELDFPSDLSTITENENVFRKFIRIELILN